MVTVEPCRLPHLDIERADAILRGVIIEGLPIENCFEGVANTMVAMIDRACASSPTGTRPCGPGQDEPLCALLWIVDPVPKRSGFDGKVQSERMQGFFLSDENATLFKRGFIPGFEIQTKGPD